MCALAHLSLLRCPLKVFRWGDHDHPAPNPVHKLLGNCSATLGPFGDFQLVGQLSMHRATSKFLCLYSHSHAPATCETIKNCRIQLVSRIYLSNLSALLLGSTCFYESVFKKQKATIKQKFRNFEETQAG